MSNSSNPTAAERLSAYVEKVVAEAPPLTPEQRDKIAALLRQPKPTETESVTVEDLSDEFDDFAALGVVLRGKR